MTDQQLVEDILQNNSQKAFVELVDKYQPLVAKTCRGFVSSYADAEDLAQEVFMEVFQSLSGFRSESKLSTWLYRIAVNKSLNFVKKQKRNGLLQSIEGFFSGVKGSTSSNLEVEDESNASPEETVINKEKRKILKSAINSLPQNQRIAFILSKYQDLSYKEIAEVMDISLSSVESLLFRAKANLQKKLSAEIKKS
ncbi:MAG TPA: sigma-70 family RNA polymerase sigma factor [Tenuifilaceae bacterium]|nr:sigma-70 family RNA polymerase sigma factor [Tenuifilaceae bacterium]HPE18318.1 sigma-70 family RNA polymerase sigma factor [Tenuifilaceae bacterium]HPJ47100.1 sigma-70 family RNA polymerase sigma factor [Tenuifilaceae bacterium]HPQ33090.1 sigma-70 family RNA polymerase sigma factor [Tenuifilaceae bacterium]